MARSPRPLIAGNWKMNSLGRDGLREARAVVNRVRRRGRLRCEVLLCPPVTLLAPLRAVLRGSAVRLGGQDCHAAASGAHTGDVAAEMLRDAGCRYVIVGHSERRRDHGESSRDVRAKAEAAHRAGLSAIVCIGETAAERRAGRTLDIVGRQLRDSLPKRCTAADTVVAYEPVWAIGTGLTPTPEDVAAVHGSIRKRLGRRLGSGTGAAMRLLYGGSVNGANAATLLSVDNVDGALVGGASLRAADFWPIVEARA